MADTVGVLVNDTSDNSVAESLNLNIEEVILVENKPCAVNKGH
jgi:hypothetical protein